MLKLILSPVTCTLIAIGIAAPTQVLAAPQDVTVRCVRKIERFEPLYKNDAAGRLAYISSAACNYKEVVGTGLFDGVHSTATGFTDLTNGRGDTRGITVAEKDGDSYRVEWLGRCYPVGRSSNGDIVRCTGVWSLIEGSGVGKFAGLRGGGYWHMQMTADGGLDTAATGVYDK